MTDLPAQEHDAETALLGAALSGAPELDELLEIVRPGDFYAPVHEAIWNAIGVVHRSGVQPEPVSVAPEIAKDPPRGYSPVMLFDLVHNCPAVVSAGYYAERVARASGLRSLQVAGTKVHQLAGESGDLDELRERARQVIDAATHGRSLNRGRTIGDVLPDVLEIAQHGQAAALPTGWPDLDRIISGLGPGRLVIVGARPGVGKSLMGANLAVHFAHRHRHAVHFASMEMTENEVVQRMLASHARVNLTALQNGQTDPKSWDRIAAKHNEIEAMPINIDDAAEQTVTHIRAAVRNARRRREDLALVVVDYLQLMKIANGNGNRAQDLGEVSRGLKLLARESNSCVVAMAQLNRDAAGDRPPKSSDLRESGSIEADADQVILLHQPDLDIPELMVIVDKNRHGPKGQATLMVEGHYASLQSVAWTPSRPVTGRPNLTTVEGGRR